MLEILDEISGKIDDSGDIYESAFLIDGSTMSSPLDIPIEARILVVSKQDTFKGITGLDQFEGHAAAT